MAIVLYHALLWLLLPQTVASSNCKEVRGNPGEGYPLVNKHEHGKCMKIVKNRYIHRYVSVGNYGWRIFSALTSQLCSRWICWFSTLLDIRDLDELILVEKLSGARPMKESTSCFVCISLRLLHTWVIVGVTVGDIFYDISASWNI